jgi:hypothetical protein
MSKDTTYNFNAQTQAVINNLREKLGYDSNAEVLAKSITLLNLAADSAINGGATVIGGQEVVL